MRIVIIGTRGFPNVQGGVEKHCECLAVNLAELGIDVTVFTRKPYIDVRIKEYRGVRLIHIPTLRHKYIEAFLHTFICILMARSLRPDILHIHGIGPAFFIPVAKLLGFKVVLTTHGSNYKHLKWGKFAKRFLKIAESIGVKHANAVIAISQPIKTELKSMYNVESEVIPNGVSIPLSSSGDMILKKYKLIKKKYILGVGRLVPEKGFDILLEAFNRIDEQDWKLVIVGNSDHKDGYCTGLENKAKHNKSVVLTGVLMGADLGEVYQHAGLFVNSSYYEGMPIVLLEAMSYGLSCIASDIPANRILNMDPDRYFRSGDSRDLYEKIYLYMKTPMSKEERDKQLALLKAQYNWENIAKKTRTVYKKLILD